MVPHRGKVEGGLVLTNGWYWGFQEGHVFYFERPGTFFTLQDPGAIPRYYGPVRMSRVEMVELARGTIRKLGVALEDVLAEQEPVVEQARGIGTNVVPRFQVRWRDPRGGDAAVLEINAQDKRVESLRFVGRRTLYRPPPAVTVQPGRLPPESPLQKLNEAGGVNPAYALRLIPLVLEAIGDWSGRLGWSLALPLTTNHVERFYVSDQGGWPHAEVTLTNGWFFRFRNSGLTQASSPRSFFESDRLPFRFRDYVGQWKLTEDQAIERARQALARLDFPAGFLHTAEAPRVVRPEEIAGLPTIPRLQLEWAWPNREERSQWIQVEVDAERGTVESIMVDDTRLWGKPPLIDVPIADPSLRRN
ncbi:MAG: hypothetical protein J0M24_21425 [Verrucomicrobia bacterium]|nr:hypothetical protein [Verrucomicrobiota bacterium]